MADKEEQDMLNQEEANHEGEDVDELLTKHKAEIDKLRGLLGGELPQPSSEFPYYDDLFLLRYILSFTSAEKAKVPVQKTLAWRREPAVSAMLSKCDNNGLEWQQDKVMRTMEKYNANAILACRHDQAPVVVIRPALSNPGPMYDNMTYEEMHLCHYAYREIAFRECDRLTREKRKIIKQSLLMDLEGVRFAMMMDRRGQKIHQPVSVACANYYPQLQSKFVLIHPPSWISVMMNLMRRIMPKRNMDKIGLCPAQGRGDVRKCPYASKFYDHTKLPGFLGGTLPDSDLPIQLTGAHVVRSEGDDGGDGLSRDITVAARSKEEVRLDAPVGGAGVSVDWSIYVAAYGIKMSAVLEKEDGGIVVLRDADEVEKIKNDGGLVKGSWPLPAPGKIVITLDNSYSMMRSKQVKCSVSFQVDEQVVISGSSC